MPVFFNSLFLCAFVFLVGVESTPCGNKEVELKRFCRVTFVQIFSFSPNNRFIYFFSQSAEYFRFEEKSSPRCRKSAGTLICREKFEGSACLYSWIVLPWSHSPISCASVNKKTWNAQIASTCTRTRRQRKEQLELQQMLCTVGIIGNTLVLACRRSRERVRCLPQQTRQCTHLSTFEAQRPVFAAGEQSHRLCCRWRRRGLP